MIYWETGIHCPTKRKKNEYLHLLQETICVWRAARRRISEMLILSLVGRYTELLLSSQHGTHSRRRRRKKKCNHLPAGFPCSWHKDYWRQDEKHNVQRKKGRKTAQCSSWHCTCLQSILPYILWAPRIIYSMAGCLQMSGETTPRPIFASCFGAATKSTSVSSLTLSLLRTPCGRPRPPSPLAIRIKLGSSPAGMSSSGLYPFGHPISCSQYQVDMEIMSSSVGGPDARWAGTGAAELGLLRGASPRGAGATAQAGSGRMGRSPRQASSVLPLRLRSR